MRYVRMLGLAAIAAAALTAWVGAGTASATEITCNGSKCAVGATFHSISIGDVVLDAPFGNIECESTIHDIVNTAGSTTTTVKVNTTRWEWTNCDGNIVSTLSEGTHEIHTEGASANGNGIFTSSGARFTVVHLGVHCIFETNNTTLGTVTGGTDPRLDISATIPRKGGEGGILCGSSAPLTGTYTVTSPQSLIVH